jgi:hypothetical protein
MALDFAIGSRRVYIAATGLGCKYGIRGGLSRTDKYWDKRLKCNEKRRSDFKN